MPEETKPYYVLLIGNTPLSVHSTRPLAYAEMAAQRAAWVATNPHGKEPEFWVFASPFKG